MPKVNIATRPMKTIVHYAYEYARLYGRHLVTCLVKDNIMTPFTAWALSQSF